MQVWDTNSLASVCHFGLPDRVFALDMSEAAAVHCLIAVGSAEPQACFASHLIIATESFRAAQMTSHANAHLLVSVLHASQPGAPHPCTELLSLLLQVKLCDLASGAFTHSLVGHREAVWALHWSPTSEWHLFTSAADGQVHTSLYSAHTKTV